MKTKERTWLSMEEAALAAMPTLVDATAGGFSDTLAEKESQGVVA